MKIIDWHLIQHVLPPGGMVVLQKAISGRKSVFCWRTVMFLGIHGTKALFQFQQHIYPRDSSDPDYEPTMYYLASYPSAITWVLKAEDGELVKDWVNRNLSLGHELFAREQYWNIQHPAESENSLKIQIEIDLSDFAFIKHNDFKQFVEKTNIKRALQLDSWIDLPFRTAKKIKEEIQQQLEDGYKYIYGRNATFELEQIFNDSTQTTSNDYNLYTPYVNTVCIYKLHNTYLWQLQDLTEWNSLPLVYSKSTSWTCLPAEERFAKNNSPALDECAIDLWQIVNFVYPTMEWDWEQIVPSEFILGWTLVQSSEEVFYMDHHWEQRIIVQPRLHHAPEVSSEYGTWSTMTFTTTSNNTRPYVVINNNGGMEWGSLDQAMTQLINSHANKSNMPAKLDLAPWDIVYIKNEKLWSKYMRKNREYTVLAFIWMSGNSQQIYKIQAYNKKNINSEWSIEVSSENLTKIEKVTKRKFTLVKDFGKYKAGESFTKDELVQIFWKFQDARDPFILNKLYTCAE